MNKHLTIISCPLGKENINKKVTFCYRVTIFMSLVPSSHTNQIFLVTWSDFHTLQRYYTQD